LARLARKASWAPDGSVNQAISTNPLLEGETLMAEQLPHLVKMANQIALNLSFASDEDAAVQHTAAHLRKFWTPAMIRKLRDYIVQGGEGCSPLVHRALLEQF
jgi:formate dehydrogenase subunit delta